MEKKKVLIIGANGKIGKLTCKKIAEISGFTPIAGIRKEDQVPFFEEQGIEYRLINLEASVEKLQQWFDGIDCIVFTAGSGGKTGYDKTLEIDLDAAVKSMEAAKSAGIDRFIIVSAFYADDREAWNTTGIKPYYIAKHYADEALKRSGLQYTILRPARLLDGSGTGKIATTADTQSELQIFRDDVAAVIVEVLSNQHTVGKSIDLINGHEGIQEALNAVK